MTRNMNNLDRVLRAILVLALIGFALYLQGVWGIVFGVLAAIFLFTSVTGFCPLYRLFGFSTLHNNRQETSS